MEEETVLSFRLFNCDHTFNLDKVETLIQQVSKKLSRVPTIEKTYFPLPRMKGLCEELEKEGGHFEYAVFVVHAHESRLSINEKNAGIGYARLYRALQKVTDDKVLIVIGGDDSYKDQGERDNSVISRWARLKIFSQFTEDYFNGVKSFIFSWEDKHHHIHEEALEFYLDPEKKGSQFVPRPRTPPGKDIPIKEDIKKIEQVENRNGDSQRGQQPFAQHPLVQQPSAQHPLVQQPSAQHPSVQQPFVQTFLNHQFPPENNKNRTLPSRPPELRAEDETKLLQVKSQATNPRSQPTQPDTAQVFPASSTTPVAHIQSFYSSPDSVHHMEKLVIDVFQTQRISSKPVKHDWEEKIITLRIEQYRPRYLLLVSDFDHFADMHNLDYQVKLYQDIIKISSNAGTKLVFVITKDRNYREGDLISGAVEKVFSKLNEKIDRSEQPMMMSWNTTPWTCHKNELIRFLSPLCSDVPIHAQECLPEYDGENRRLKYRASISNGHVVAVVKSDPPGWQPDTCYLDDVLKKQEKKGKATLEFWEKRDKTIEVSVTNDPAKLFKISEGVATHKQHSILVYSYHSKEHTFDTMKNFMQFLGVHDLSPSQLMDPASLMNDIKSTSPDYVMFSADVDVIKELQDSCEVNEYIQKYGRVMKDTIENHVGKEVILMLFGDQFYKDGELASKEITKKCKKLIKNLVQPEKVIVMTCNMRLYIEHQNLMKRLLVKDTTTSPTGNLGAASCVPFDKKDKGTQQTLFRSDKGHLRFRLAISNGQVEKEWCYPGWKTDEVILNNFLDKNRKEKKATLEIWVNDDGDISSITEETVTKGRMESAWNSFSSLWRGKDKYV